jgi:hypothetical protein
LSNDDEDIEIGDMDPDDLVTEGDEEVDFSQVDLVQEQVDAINDIADDDERTSAAKRWAKELAGEEIG